MHIDVLILATDYGVRMDKLARALEDRGFESLFVPEQTHIPSSRRMLRSSDGAVSCISWRARSSLPASAAWNGW